MELGKSKIMKFTVTYISLEGRIVHTEIEADTREEAVAEAYRRDAEFSSGDNIYEVIGVD